MTVIPAKPKAYSYLRFSRPEQALGDSLRRQLEGARDYADEHGLELDDSLRDEGISAFKSKNRDDNTALDSFLNSVKAGLVPKGSFLLVESLDRLSRDQVPIALRLFLNILEYGITIVTLADKHEYSNASISAAPTDLILSISVMMRAHEESAMKSGRLKKTWAKKRAEAEVSGKAMTRICPGWIEKRGDRYVLIDERANLVRRIFRMSTGGMGTRSIAKTFNSERRPTWGVGKKKGRIWYDSYIKKILENPATYGEFTPRGTRAGGSEINASTPIRGYYPAAIDFKTFQRARAMLEARAGSSVRSTAGKHRNVLSGLLKCEVCGGGMHYIDKGKRGGLPYLQCGSSLLHGGCDHNDKHPYATLETAMIMKCSATVREEENDRLVNVKACASTLADVQRRLENVVNGIESYGMSDTLGRRLKSLEREMVLAENEMAKANKAANRADVANSFGIGMKEAATLAMQLRDEPENAEIRVYATNMVRSVFEKISIGPKRIFELWTYGFTAEPRLPIEEDVMKLVRRWLDGPQDIDPNQLYENKVFPPLISQEEIQSAESELKALMSPPKTK